MEQIEIIEPIPLAVMFDWGTTNRKPAKLKGRALEIENKLKIKY